MPEYETYTVSVTVECEVIGFGRTPSDFISPVADCVREALPPNLERDEKVIRRAVITAVHARKE